MPFADLANVRLSYSFDGPPDAPVVLLSNSLGTTSAMWEPQVPELAKQFRVLRYDSRGHGQSGVTPGPYSIPQLGRDVLALLDHLGLSRVDFCGLSMGGMVGQWVGVNAPGRIRVLALCNTAAQIGPVDAWNARISKVNEGGMEAIVDAVLARWFTPGFMASARETVAPARAMLASTPPAGYVAACAAVRDMDQREAIARIAAPTLVIAGAHDAATPPAEGRFLAERIGGAQYVELDAAHLSNLEAASEFNTALLTFLNR